MKVINIKKRMDKKFKVKEIQSMKLEKERIRKAR